MRLILPARVGQEVDHQGAKHGDVLVSLALLDGQLDAVRNILSFLGTTLASPRFIFTILAVTEWLTTSPSLAPSTLMALYRARRSHIHLSEKS